MKNKKKVKVYRKAIKKDLLNHFDCVEFKISLNFVEDKHLDLAKRFLNVVVEDKIFLNKDKFDKYNSKKFLESELNNFIFSLYGLKITPIEEMKFKKKNEIITLKKAVNLYTDKQKDRISKGTLKNYDNRKKHLFNFFDINQNVEEIGAIQAEQYQTHLSKTLSNNVVNNVMSFASGVFKHLLNRELVQKNVFNLIEYKQTTDAEKEIFTNEEIFKLLNSTNDIDYELMISLGIYSGFRIGEIQELKIENIKFDTNEIRSELKDTTTKKHTRTIPIHPNLIQILKQKIGNQKNGLLINKPKLKKSSFQNNINKYIQNIVNNKKKTFHSFRSNFAKELEDYNLKDIKILLGHKQRDITIKSYLKSNTNWNKKVEMVNSIDYSLNYEKVA